MNLKNKNVLLVGLAKTGISAIKKISQLQANVIVNDIKTEETLKDIINEIKDIKNVEYILGHHPENIGNIDMAVVSPGVPLDLPFIKKLYNNDIEVIGEVELAYRLSNNPKFIGITGTNGKTTTTSIVGEIVKRANKDSYIVGNIGNPVIDVVDDATEESILVTELSSFQLESISEFRPSVSAILNISEDHLNRHHTMENYIDAKCRVFLNQNSNDFCILNYDDIELRKIGNKCNANIIYFSRQETLEKGIYLEGNNIVIELDKKVVLMNKDNLSLPGEHNLENCMAAAGIAYCIGIDVDVIKEVLETFSAVAHRQEFIKEVNGVSFVNDSKATNPDSSIKAVKSYKNPIVLIAGGMNKNSNYEELIKVCKENVKAFVLLGETSDVIEDTAKKYGFKNIFKVNDMKEAVKVSYEVSNAGDVVLLSPACASWDMYKSFEVRGNDFKENVYKLK